MRNKSLVAASAMMTKALSRIVAERNYGPIRYNKRFSVMYSQNNGQEYNIMYRSIDSIWLSVIGSATFLMWHIAVT